MHQEEILQEKKWGKEVISTQWKFDWGRTEHTTESLHGEDRTEATQPFPYPWNSSSQSMEDSSTSNTAVMTDAFIQSGRQHRRTTRPLCHKSSWYRYRMSLLFQWRQGLEISRALPGTAETNSKGQALLQRIPSGKQDLTGGWDKVRVGGKGDSVKEIRGWEQFLAVRSNNHHHRCLALTTWQDPFLHIGAVLDCSHICYHLKSPFCNVFVTVQTSTRLFEVEF